MLVAGDKSERERVKGDSSAWRAQMAALEEEMDAQGNKWRAQLSAARDEAERQRRQCYEVTGGVDNWLVDWVVG